MEIGYPVRVIEWRDACRRDEVDRGDDLSPLTVLSTGFVIEEVDDYVALAAEVFEQGDFRDVTTIPRGMIVAHYQLRPEETNGLPPEFDHTPREAPYTEGGVACECADCLAARG